MKLGTNAERNIKIKEETIRSVFNFTGRTPDQQYFVTPARLA